MATYTTRNRLVKQATGENRNTHGTVLNAGLIDLVDDAMDGITTLSMSGNVTLTDEDGATDQARKRVINITSTGGANRTITIPTVEKWYIVENEGANLVTIKTASGTGAVVPAYCSAIVKCDGLDCFKLLQPGFGLLQSYSYTNFSASAIQVDLATGACKEFKLKVKGFSQNGAGALGVQFSSDNFTYTTSLTIQSITGASDTIYGEIDFDALSSTFGVDVKLANVTSTNTGVANTGISYAVRLTSTLSHMKLIEITSSADAGTFELWGR